MERLTADNTVIQILSEKQLESLAEINVKEFVRKR